MAMRVVVIGAALGLVLAATGGAKAADQVPPTTVLQDDMFLGSALAHTQSELELAQLVVTKAHTASLVAYARRVAADRVPLRDKLAAAAKVDGVSGDTGHTPLASSLQPLAGEAFERAYVASQLEDQQNNLDFFTFEAKTGTNAGLRRLAADELPRLQKDLADALAVVKDLPFEPVQGDEPIEVPPALRQR
jgi:putative membrane protein